MINSQMDNPFMIGDLVHIPKGVVLYRNFKKQTDALYPNPSPAKINDKATVALVIKKVIPQFYNVSIGEEEYIVMKEDITLITRKDVR